MRTPSLIRAAVAGVVLTLAASATAVASPAPTPAASAAVTDASRIAAIHTQLTNGTLAASGDYGTAGCGTKVHGRAALCDATFLTTSTTSTKALTTSTPLGYGATDLEKAYGVSKAPGGYGGIIAVIEAGAYPNLEQDLATYRAQYGLPTCTRANQCFGQVTYQGGAPYAPQDPSGLGGAAGYYEYTLSTETALDVDMASAACPNCKIVEIQIPFADGVPDTAAGLQQSADDFTTAIKFAHKNKIGAVSISYGLPLGAGINYDRDNPLVPGTAVFASTGDSGYLGASETWPANQTRVIAAGGTSLYRVSGGRGFAETAWSGGGSFGVTGGGSGCSTTEGAANGQPATIAAACNGHRASSDLSAVADPYTGVAVYNTFTAQVGSRQIGPDGWLVVGGTSAASPLLAGLAVRAGVPSDTVGPNHLYAAPEYTYNDVVLGATAGPGRCAADGYADSVCTAGSGWDGPTGLGTPKGLQTFQW